jgi:hypothetical protein
MRGISHQAQLCVGLRLLAFTMASMPLICRVSLPCPVHNVTKLLIAFVVGSESEKIVLGSFVLLAEQNLMRYEDHRNMEHTATTGNTIK